MITVQVSAYIKEAPRTSHAKVRYERYHDKIRAKVDIPLTHKQLHVTVTSGNLAWKTPAMQEYDTDE